MNFSKFKITILAIFGLFLINFILVSGVYAQDEDNYGLKDSAAMVPAFSSQVSNYSDDFLNTRIGSIIGIALSFIGVIFLVLMIYAGISWMTAAGNQEKVTKAKELIVNAIIGLIIVFAAYAITSFIGNRLL